MARIVKLQLRGEKASPEPTRMSLLRLYEHVLLVGEVPADDPLISPISPRKMAYLKRLGPKHLRISVGVAPSAPRHVPVLPAHVPAEERRYDPYPGLAGSIEHLLEPVHHSLVDQVRSGLEIAPSQEDPDRIHAQPSNGLHVACDLLDVEVPPHRKPLVSRPVVNTCYELHVMPPP